MIYHDPLYFLYLLFPMALAQYAPSPRWGQATALLGSTLYVHGGLSDPFDTYSYTSAPEISDLLVLDLSTSFNSSSPPWQHFSINSWPALAWHTLSAFSSTELLLFGGQPGPNSATVLTTLNDSAGLLSTSNPSSPSFFMESQNWANEPMRRMRQSASFTDGKVWVIGGEQADGSGNAFSEQYSFSPSSPEFVQVPSSNSGPPDIYGHASFVLPDGRLLVLGGYCASCSELVPLNTIWSLNTMHNPPVWEKHFTSNASLPSPRRDFASVVLSNGQILVHGGGDAQLQTTYSDGWILDTDQNPMIWDSVAALTQLGERRNHFAVQASGYVLFCFGYGSSAPAPATLFIYDPTTSLMVTSYDASSSGPGPAITSLPLPSQTGSDPSPDGGSGTNSSGGPSGSPSSASGSTSNHIIAIALGVSFGVIGLAAIGLAIMYYVKRARSRGKRTTGRFSPLADDPEFSSDGGSVGGAAAPEAAHISGQTDESTRGIGSGAIKDILLRLGIDKFDRKPNQPRKDMFADEEASSVGRLGAVQKRSSDETSVWSIRSVRALVRGVNGREPSGSGTGQGSHEWEKIDHLRGGVQHGLIRKGSVHSENSLNITHRRDGSFWSYTDPFEDPVPDDEYDHLNLRLDMAEKDVDYDHSVPISDETLATSVPEESLWPFSVRSRTLIPVREDSGPSLSDASNSLPSLQESSHGQITFGCAEKAALSPPTSSSPTCYSPTASRHSDPHPTTPSPLYSPVSGPALTHLPSISRADSWWSRLTKSPLLDRRMSITSSKPLDFRDPTPAPPLGKLEETKPTSSAFETSHGITADKPAGHGKSLSSAHSGRTANTDSAEHLGGSYDVVQRLSSDGSGSRRVPSLSSAGTTEHGMYAVNAQAYSESSLSSNLARADLLHSALPTASPATTTHREAQVEPLVSSKLDPSPRKRDTTVASRVLEYERKLSQELESQQISPIRNTRHREEIPSRTRPTIRYGVAPRASLFIANPDLGQFP